ncbi:MAG: uncharacterized protein A8A55_2929 [Amphiamblys sp. WSBS2006]|nr:MAG: uncharacterized protein A8A55_2929 [Amphiamblys sp. WSBS2006]
MLPKTFTCVPLVFLLEFQRGNHSAAYARPVRPLDYNRLCFEFPAWLCSGLYKCLQYAGSYAGHVCLLCSTIQAFVFESVHLKHLCISVLCRASSPRRATQSVWLFSPPL